MIFCLFSKKCCKKYGTAWNSLTLHPRTQTLRKKVNKRNSIKFNHNKQSKIFIHVNFWMNLIVENTGKIRYATIFIGFITLLGAAIGLMNIMLVSVTERTREIGVCKALGATRQNILLQFLTEAIVICQIGGFVGIILGVLLGNVMTLLFKTPFLMPWAWIFLGITLCLIVGLLSGLYPAMKAANLDPIDALRYE